ncbi:MAG: hypothetical protein ACOYW7_04970 [Nitrospirota bacterium]
MDQEKHAALVALRKIVEVIMMNYKIEYKREFNYVSLLFMGVLDMDEARACRDKLHEVLLAYSCTRVLVDTTKVTAKLSIVEEYELTKELRYELPSSVSIALIVPQEGVTDGGFIENVAVNRGVRLRAFTEKDEALAWLMKQA